MVTDVNPLIRGRFVRVTGMNRLAMPVGMRMSHRGLTVILLLASVLSMAELARTLVFFAPSTPIHRVLKINRIAEPSGDHVGHAVLAVRPITLELHPNLTDEETAYAASGLLAPSLILFTSSNPLRSPPPLS